MSWLSSNLTGGLSSISNFTGQISSFTREMLTEGTEEVSDPSAELKVSQARINELEAHLVTQKSEYERVKQNNEELHVRLEACELQISNISKEYRTQLQNKEQELIRLRELSRVHEEQGQTFGRRERHDSTDSVEDSMESKRLHSEISRLQTECQHWKSLANGMENQDQLHKEIDRYQQELTALQSSYSQKISNLNKKHKQEMQKWQEEKQEYLQRIEELEDLLQGEDTHGIEMRKLPDSSHGENQEDKSSASSLSKQLYFSEKLIAELKDQVKTQEENFTALNIELQEKNDALNKAHSSLDDTQGELNKSRSMHEQEMSASRGTLEQSHKRVEELEVQLQEQGKKMEAVGSDSENLKKLQDDLSFVAQENAELKNQLSRSHSELEAVSSDSENLNMLRDELSFVAQQNSELKDQLSRSQSEESKMRRSVEEDSENLNKLQKELSFLSQQNAELKDQLSRSQSEERRMCRSVEEVKSELEQLSGSTMELMEELQISHGVQQEQKIEMESLKNVRFVKGEGKAEMVKLRSALAALWERHLFLVQLYQQVRHELHNSNARLLAMFQARHLSTETVRDDLHDFKQRLSKRGEARLEHVVRDKEVAMGRSADTSVVVEELEGGVMDLQSDNEQVAQETKDCVTEIGRQPDMEEEEGGDIVTALQAEKAVLESTIVGLEKKVQDLEELVLSLQDQKQWRENNESVEGQNSGSGSAESVSSLTGSTPLASELSMDMGDLRRESDAAEPEVRRETEVSLQGSFSQEGDSFPPDHGISQRLSVPELQQQLDEYQQHVEEFELVRRDWEGEKEALEGLVLSLRRQVKEVQSRMTNLAQDNSTSEEQLARLRDENLQISSEKGRLVEAWKSMEDAFVSLDISSPRVDDDFELDAQRINSLRLDLKDWVLSKSEHRAPDEDVSSEEPGNSSVESHTEESINLLRHALDDFEKDNSLLREQTERLIQEIEEKTSQMTDLQIELEKKSDDLRGIGDEKRNLMGMINERDERICELEESFNAHLLDLTTSKDDEISSLQTEREDVVKLLEENRKESALLRNKNDELLDMMGQNQQANDELGEKNVSLASTLAEIEVHLESERGEKKNLITVLQDKDQLNASLVAENNSLLMEKEVLQSLVEEYKDKYRVEQSENAGNVELKEKIKELTERIQQREDGWRELEEKRAALSQENERFEDELRLSRAEVDNMKRELKEKVSEIEMLGVEKGKLGEAASSQISTLKDLEQRFSDSVREVEEVKDSLGAKDLEVDKLELDLREKGAENDLLRLDIAQLSKKLKEKEQVIHAQVVKAPDSGPQGGDDARYRLVQLLRLLEEKDQEIAALKQKDASLVELVSRTDRSSHQAHEEYEVKIQQGREERDRLLADLSLRDEELLTLQDRLEAMGEKMQGKDQASHMLHAEHARLLALNESQANEMGKLRERNSSLQKLVEGRERGKSTELQQAHDENSQLRRQMSALQIEHETLSTLVHEKDKQIATLALLGGPAAPDPSPHGTDVDHQQVKRLMEEREVLLRERDSVHREKKFKEQQISQLQEEVHSQRQTLQEKTSLAANLAAENDELGKRITDLQSQLKALSVDKSNLAKSDNRIIQLEEEIDSIRELLENKDSELKQTLESNRNEKSSILVELENVRNERDDISEQKDTETRELKNKILRLARSLTDSEHWQQENFNVEDIGRNFQTLIHTVSNHRNSVLRERDNEIKSLREQLSNMTLLTKSSQAHDGLEEVLREKEELHRMLLQSRDEKEDLLREKESVVADLQDQVISLGRVVSDKERASHQDLERVIHEKERIVKELDQVRRESNEVNRASSRWQSEITRLQAELHELKGVLTHEREAVTSLQREVEQFKMAVDEKERIAKELMVEREQLQRSGEQLQRSGEQLQHRVQQLQEELSAASSGQKVAETKRVQELERLRNHLVQVEESYTREALEAEERERDLRMKIARAEEQLVSSSHSLLDRDRQASSQIESLHEQLQALASQRDRAVMELASAQEQAHQYQTSLNNLQLVLEQFQKERESQLKGTQEQAQKEVHRAWAEVKAMQQRENQLRSQLEMAARVTQEVMDLRGQLNLKQEELQKHKEEVNRLEDELRVSHERIKSLNSMSDNKVEKSLLKNLLIGYFNTPENKRVDVMRVIGGLLGFTHEELDTVGTGSSAPRGSSWISSLNPFGHAPPKTPTRTTAPTSQLVSIDKSFSELFVSFLESESEAPHSNAEGGVRVNVSNPLLSGLTPQQSPVPHHVLPGGGRPMATSTPIGTPARNNLPTLPPSSLSRPLTGTVSHAMDGVTRPSSSGSTTGNPLLVGSLAPAQELPALSSSSSLRTLLEGRT